MKPPPELCSHCGAKIVMYKHSLTKPLVRCLDAIAKVGGGPINLAEVGLTRNQWCNFQKLRYFGLVEMCGSRTGVWQLTERGRDFLAGRIAVRRVAITYRGDVEEFEGPKVYVTQVDGLYQPRTVWAQEAIPVDPR